MPRTHEPQPWCEGCAKDFHTHPAKAVANLTDVMRLGKCGLNAIFKPGTRWNYGPVYENLDTVVKVRSIQSPAYASTTLTNCSMQPEDNEAYGQPCWFIRCEVVSSPHKSYIPGQHVNLPPTALVPHNVVRAERRCWAKAAREATTKDCREATTKALSVARSLEQTKRALATAEDALRDERVVTSTWKERAVKAQRERDGAVHALRASQAEVAKLRDQVNAAKVVLSQSDLRNDE